MMTFVETLGEKKDSIVRRWCDAALATYPADGAAAFKRQKDRFANPVGHSLRVGTRGVFEALLDAADDEEIRRCLHEMIKIRAVQEFSPSQAVGFVFRLKEAVRGELGKAANETRFASDLAAFERRIDRVALAAFDVFVECREQLCRLRMNEMKRSVSWIVEKLNQRGRNPELARVDLEQQRPRA